MHLQHGRRWRIRRGLFPPDFFRGSDWWRVRVHRSPLAGACFEFDPNIGNWNLPRQPWSHTSAKSRVADARMLSKIPINRANLLLFRCAPRG
jgi:hypothetical protein